MCVPTTDISSSLPLTANAISADNVKGAFTNVVCSLARLHGVLVSTLGGARGGTSRQFQQITQKDNA